MDESTFDVRRQDEHCHEVRDYWRYSHDSPQFKPLVKTTARNFTIREVEADKAYSSKGNLELVAKVGGKPYIPFKTNTTGENEASELWEKLWHVYQYNRDEFLTYYHKRSNVESTMWMIKSKFDEHIRNKTDEGIINELLWKVLCHNICMVIQSMYELGIEPMFWTEHGTQKVEPTLCVEMPVAHKVPFRRTLCAKPHSGMFQDFGKCTEILLISMIPTKNPVFRPPE